MNIHFIAIGGSVMHQLAIALKNKGYCISGSDDEIFEPALTNLEKAGILPPAVGWYPEKITVALDAVILGMHARQDNPELLKAQELGIRIYSFPEYIFEESKNKTRIVIGGSHGKTTITAMIMHVLRQAGLPFDYLVGAKLEGFDQSVQITDAPVIVCEGDEYPASAIEKKPKFHFLHPHIAVLSGIAWDHVNVFPSFEVYKAQFAVFIQQMEKGGILIFNDTDAVLRKIVKQNGQRLNLLPYSTPANRIEEGITTVQLGHEEGPLQVFGEHNLLNVHAARLVCNQLGIDDARFLSAIGSFKGAAHRLELVGKNEHTTIYRDFAHAPSKVRATIRAVKQQYPSRKLIAVLELHTYSSLNAAFLSEYKGTMDAAEVAVVYYSKHALEIKRMPELQPEQIREGFGRADLQVFHQRMDLEQFLDQQSYHHCNLLMMSSGTYDGLDFTRLKKYLHKKTTS